MDHDPGVEALRLRVRETLRAIRHDIDPEQPWNQEKFGKAFELGSRFVMTRLESGADDLSLAQAEQVDAKLDAEFEGVAQRLMPLVRHRDRATRASVGLLGRDELVARMVEVPGVTRVRAVLLDDVDLASVLIAMPSPPDEVVVVVPSRTRDQELSRGRHLHRFAFQQVDALFDWLENTNKRHERTPDRLRIVESDEALFPAVQVDFAWGSEVAYWPPSAMSHRKSLPVATSADPDVTKDIAQEIDRLVAGGHAVQPNEVVAQLGKETTGASSPPPIRFSKFSPRGRAANLDGSGTTGEHRRCVPVALVLVHATTLRDPYSIGPRILLHRRKPNTRDSQGKLSLLATRLVEKDLRDVLGLSQPDEGLRERDPGAAAIEVVEAMGDPTLTTAFFQQAALRELDIHWELELEHQDLEPRPLPPELSSFVKQDDQLLVPQFFTLEAVRDPRNLFACLSTENHRHAPEIFGLLDFLELPDEELNDFLVAARKNDAFISLLRDELKIVDR